MGELSEIHARLGRIEGAMDNMADIITAAVIGPIEAAGDRTAEDIKAAIGACRAAHEPRIGQLEKNGISRGVAIKAIEKEHTKTRYVVVALGIITMLLVAGVEFRDALVGLVGKLIGCFI